MKCRSLYYLHSVSPICQFYKSQMLHFINYTKVCIFYYSLRNNFTTCVCIKERYFNGTYRTQKETLTYNNVISTVPIHNVKQYNPCTKSVLKELYNIILFNVVSSASSVLSFSHFSYLII